MDPKNEYPISMVDMQIDPTFDNEMISFIDCHSGYNQIFIIKEDIFKIAFNVVVQQEYLNEW